MSIFAKLRRHWASLKHLNDCRRAVLELQQLDDAQLRDLGIERDQIVAYAFGKRRRPEPEPERPILRLAAWNEAPARPALDERPRAA